MMTFSQHRRVNNVYEGTGLRQHFAAGGGGTIKVINFYENYN
jgi:hypothetical protein